MRKIISLIILVAVAFFGCTGKELSKQQYYEQGVKYLQNGNANGAIIAFKKALENDQNYFEARYQLGLAYLERNKYDSAEREFLKVLRLNPSFVTARIALTKTYIGKSKIDDAVKEITIYLDKINNDPEAFDVAATAYALKGAYPTAEAFLKKSLKISPGRASSKTILAEIYWASRRTDEADRLIGEVLASNTKDKNALSVAAKIKQQQGKLEEVINVYKRLNEIDSNDLTAQFELGFAYLRNNKIEEVRKIIEKMFQAQKENAEAHYLTGVLHFKEEKIDDAIVSLQKSLKVKSTPGAYYYLGLCNLRKGDLEQATSEFQKVVDIRPDTVQARLLLAATHLKRGRALEAEKEAKKVLELEKDNALAHNLLGNAYLASNKGDMAMEEFDKAIELNPAFVEAHISKGAFSLMSGNDEIAEKEFISAVKIAPELLNSRIMLAKYYIKSKRFHEAVNTLKGGLKGNDNDSVIYNLIGTAYVGAGDIESGKQNFEKAISSNPKFYLPYFNLALLYFNNGEKAMAIKQYKRVLDIDKNNITALLMLAKIMDADHKEQEAFSYYTRAKETGKPEAYLALAMYYKGKNNNKQAIKVLQEALSINSGNIKAREMIGLLHIADKNYNEALSISKELKESSPEIGTEMIANVYAAMGEYDSALAELKGLLLNAPNRIDVLGKMVELYTAKKDFANAERTAKEVISLKPQGDAGYLMLASVYMESHQFQDALNAVKKAQELNPRSLEVRTATGKIYMSMNELQKAAEVFGELERAYPKYEAAYIYQANILEKAGQKKDAVEKYKKILEVFPSSIAALNNLSYLYIEGYGPVEKALEMAKKAKELSPGDGSITDTLGWALYKTDRYDEALKYFIEATHYLPGEPTVRYHLALVYLKKGMQDKAEEQFKNSIRLGRIYPFNEFKDAQQMLAGLGRK